jgi:peptidylprolyl isomerase
LTLTAAACSSSGSGSSAGSGSGSPALPQVSGAVGQKADVTLPKGVAAPKTLLTKVLVQGSGTALASGDLAAVNYTAVDWTGDKALVNTYSPDGGKTPNQPQVVTLGASGLLPAWNTALTGAKVGSRIEIVAPPADAFGSSGNSQAGIAPTDDLVFVMDVVSGYKGSVDITGTQGIQTDTALPKVAGNPGGGGPTITVPVGVTPPKSLVSDVLIHGSGEAVASGQTLIMQYTGVDWNTGKVFDSSFTRQQAFSTVIGQGQVIAGWDQGLVGKHVGDRVLLVIPPALGYGPEGGQATVGIGKNDTLIFVVDIIDSLN